MCGPSSGCMCRPIGLSVARKYAADRDDLSARRLQYPTLLACQLKVAWWRLQLLVLPNFPPYLQILPALGQERCTLEVLSVVAPPHAFLRRFSVRWAHLALAGMHTAYGHCSCARACRHHRLLRHHIGANRMPQISKEALEINSAWLLTFGNSAHETLLQDVLRPVNEHPLQRIILPEGNHVYPWSMMRHAMVCTVDLHANDIVDQCAQCSLDDFSVPIVGHGHTVLQNGNSRPQC